MRMGTLAGIVVAAASMALVGLSSAQSDSPNSFETTPIEGWNFVVAGQGAKKPSQERAPAALNKKITKRFNNVNLSEVLAWLSLQDLSFVADMGAFPDKKVTFNFVNQPLSKVLDVIADSFGGSWQKRGDIYTLTPKSALARSFSVEANRPRNFELVTPNLLKNFETTPLVRANNLPTRNFTPAFKWDGPGLLQVDKQKELTPEQRKEVEKAVAEAKGAIKKAIEELKSHKGEIQGLNDKQLDELIKQLNDIIGKTLPGVFQYLPGKGDGKSFIFDGGEMKLDHKVDIHVKELMDKAQVLNKKDLEKMMELKELHGMKGLQDKELAEKMRVLEKMDIDKMVQEHLKGKDLQKLKVLEGKDLEKMMELKELHGMKGLQDKGLAEKMKVLEKMDIDKMVQGHLKGMDLQKMKGLNDKELAEKMKLFGKTDGINVFSSQRIGDLAKSLTPEQKATMKKNGYLKSSELSPKQREMLGSMGDGNWEITIVKDGEKITIKNGS